MREMTNYEAAEKIRKDICPSKYCNDSCMYGKNICPYDMAETALKEIQQYRQIGTVEECRQAMEKQKPKKPEFLHMLNDTKYTARCKCGHRFTADIDYRYNPKFCSKCGIEFDWSEGDEKL